MHKRSRAWVHTCAQVWLGYTQSLRPTQCGLTVNMDMAATAFLEVQPVIDFLMRAVGFRTPAQFAGAPPAVVRKAERVIKGLKARMMMVVMLHLSSVCMEHRHHFLREAGKKSIGKGILQHACAEKVSSMHAGVCICMHASAGSKPSLCHHFMVQARMHSDVYPMACIICTGANATNPGPTGGAAHAKSCAPPLQGEGPDRPRRG